ncbi:MAG: uroporphyrinogen-III synthase [Sphingomonadaceae bacterium]
MERRLLITRPAEEILRTTEAAMAAGWDTLAAPLLRIEGVEWEVPSESFDALLLTSPRSVPAATLHPIVAALPVYAVGPWTATAARAQGLTVVRTGETDGSAIVAAIAADGHRSVLHLCGAHQAALVVPPGLLLQQVPVYHAVTAAALPSRVAAALAADEIFATLLFSPRTAASFDGLVAAAGLDRGRLRLVVLSEKVAAAAGPGWRAVVITEKPALSSALAAAAALWQSEQHV